MKRVPMVLPPHPGRNLLVDDMPWILNDVTIGNRSVFSSTPTDIDAFVSFETAPCQMDSIVIGPHEIIEDKP